MSFLPFPGSVTILRCPHVVMADVAEVVVVVVFIIKWEAVCPDSMFVNSLVIFLIFLTLFTIHLDVDQIPSLKSKMKDRSMYSWLVNGRLNENTVFWPYTSSWCYNIRRVKISRYDIVIKQWCCYYKCMSKWVHMSICKIHNDNLLFLFYNRERFKTTLKPKMT